jgi:hypothetical protein
MPARNTRPVARLVDDAARPPRHYEAVTASEHALAFYMGGTYRPDRPDHGDGALLTAIWGVIPHRAPADVVPAWVRYDRAKRLPFEVHGQRYTQLGDAMEAAV